MGKFENQFKCYDVPEKIRNTAICIMRRFTIIGQCDGMYICNVIALESGIGDGQGHFTGNTDINAEKCAAALRDAYSNNIFRRDIDELEDILRTGKLDVMKAASGLRDYISSCHRDKKVCPIGREGYLDLCIQAAKKTLNELSSEVMNVGNVGNVFDEYDRNKLERAKKLITEVYESNYGSPRSSKETKKLETIIQKIDSILQKAAGGKE